MWGYGMEGTKYIFAQIHFHWGEVDDGSEHTVAGKHWPVELHLVHYDQKYGSFANAASSGMQIFLLIFYGKRIYETKKNLKV